MLNVALDTIALAFLIKVLGDEEPGTYSVWFLALGAAFAACFMGFLFVSQIGPLGYCAAGLVVAIGLACSLNLFVGAEIRKALAIGALFVILHAVIGLGLSATLEGRVPRRLILPLGPRAREERAFEKMKVPAEEFRKLAPDVQRFFEPEEDR
jgi:hypothetical protein